MTDPHSPHDLSERDQLLREGADWFFLMRGRDAADHREAFEAWLARGALHRGAYNRAAEIYSMGKVLEGKRPPQSASASRVHWTKLALAGVIGALGLTGGWFLTNGFVSSKQGSPESVATSASFLQFATASGEVRRTRLPDGSFVTLQGSSVLRIEFDGARRRLHLFRGAGRFEVAHERRPFVVAAGGGTITAHGTVFDVIVSDQHRVTVRLVQGEIDVVPALESPASAPPMPRRLTGAGEMTFRGIESPALPRKVEQTVPSAAATGNSAPVSMREFEEIRLADLIGLANAAGDTPIVFQDAALGDKRVSGRFRLDGTERLAEHLALLLDLKIERRSNMIVLRAR